MSDRPIPDDELFGQLAHESEALGEAVRSPSRLKSRVYSALVRRQQQSGSLLNLTETRHAGHELCVFEVLWEHLPLTTGAKCFNCCSICHARVLGEQAEHAPIFWGGCPYVAFQKK
ncbi:MAG TPA: hypothetical protein VMW38_08350 [Terriglobia bacterium]|nr:hypothetical protein [Terriglobia bacterium]